MDRSHKVTGSYMKAATSSAVLKKIRKLGAPKRTKTPEGFLFPATYTLTAGSSARQLVNKQLQAFKQNFAHVNMRYAHSKHLTRYDVLIIASMIEREAELARERPLVAAVIYNRLKQGMPLGIDATIRYYTNNWQRPIRESELQKRRAVQHPAEPRSAADADRQPRPRLAPGRRPSRPQALPLLRAQARQVRRPRVLLDRRAVRARRGEVPEVPRAVIRLGVCGWPVAHSRSPRMHNAALAALGLTDWRYQLLPVPPRALRGDGARAPGGRLPGRQRDDPAQGGGARAGGRAPRRPRARSARRTR